jgi:two-component sensor histidine kinase
LLVKVSEQITECLARAAKADARAEVTNDPNIGVSLIIGECWPVRLQLRGPDFDVGPESARHLALLFHELATKCRKVRSAIPSRRKGLCRLAMEPHQTLFDLEGIRRAKDHVAAEQARFGSQLIDVSVKSLSGTIEPNFHPDGFTCSMNLRFGKCSQNKVE